MSGACAGVAYGAHGIWNWQKLNKPANPILGEGFDAPDVYKRQEPDQKITNNGPRLHEFIQELSRETFQKGDLITVGEAWGADIERAKLYSNPDGSEFSMVFQLSLIHIFGL